MVNLRSLYVGAAGAGALSLLTFFNVGCKDSDSSCEENDDCTTVGLLFCQTKVSGLDNSNTCVRCVEDSNCGTNGEQCSEYVCVDPVITCASDTYVCPVAGEECIDNNTCAVATCANAGDDACTGADEVCVDDGSCAVPSCTNSGDFATACTLPSECVDDGSCAVPSCTNVAAYVCPTEGEVCGDLGSCADG